MYIINIIFLYIDYVDYVPVEDELTVFPGQEPITCTNLTIIADRILESNEVFNVSIATELPGVNFGISQSMITITDNDGRLYHR